MKEKWILFCTSLFLLTSCSHYKPIALETISTEFNQTKVDRLSIVAKAFTKGDCKRYLDRDVINKGFQPVQIYIINGTDKTYHFSPLQINLPTIASKEVAKKMHTSTIGRISTYGAASLLASPLFAVPGVVDGFNSAKSNSLLDRDFASKGAKDQLIYPFSEANMILFFPNESYEEEFIITLTDQATNQQVLLPAKIR